MYIGESPALSFKKTLCCNSCVFSSIRARAFLAKKENRLRLGLGAVGIFVLLLCVVAILAYKCVTARLPDRRMKGLNTWFEYLSASTYSSPMPFDVEGVYHSILIIPKPVVCTSWSDFAKASSSTYLYTYKELKAATRNFREDNKLGEGGIGEVYLVRPTNIIQNCRQKAP